MNNSKLAEKLQNDLRRAARFRLLSFIVVVTLLYGFIVWRINALYNAPVTSSALDSAQKATPRPHIDQATVDKITQLQDNNVNAQALFDQARQNPFHE